MRGRFHDICGEIRQLLDYQREPLPPPLPPPLRPAAAGTGSPAQAEGGGVVGVTPLASTSVSPSGIPAFSGGAPPTAGGGINSSADAAVGGGSPSVGGASEGGGSTAPPGRLGGGAGEGEGAEAGDGEGGSKMGLQLSALFVQRALMVFRRERAAMVRKRERDKREQYCTSRT